LYVIQTSSCNRSSKGKEKIKMSQERTTFSTSNVLKKVNYQFTEKLENNRDQNIN
jgi:hypothetical protein